MISSTIVASLILGLAHIPSIIAQPVASNSTDVLISLTASDYFPNAKGNLSLFDVDCLFSINDADTRSWLSSLDPASATTDEGKAIVLTEAAYSKKFDANDLDMVEDVEEILALVAGNTTSLEKRSGSSTFSTSSRHAVKWTKCGAFLACVSGYSCGLDITIDSAPRSKCATRGGSLCCLSWSTYKVRAAFFSTTWTSCNSEVKAEDLTEASCEGHGSSAQGGDVCLSNRATHCG
ncbi:hypothetical protein N7495_008356 [Penicillium taxi]|uniref:uncharacterized protein n=1 Tax=Penicillium taxi TaxID=168475 RepID=UPI0025455383|nr:uncharacterized protein N7495_008356 [Penicillium taxi]KAJ5888315.1 hypothetical protein N7495_008356 [Penicillium taxi]